MDVDRRRDIALRAARAGADAAMAHFRTDLTPDTKGAGTDPVTVADREAQRRALATLADADPGTPVVGEEGDARKTLPETGTAWVVDPVDGTRNFVHGAPRWATLVAAVTDRRPVAAATVLPALGETVVGTETLVRHDGDRTAVSERTDTARFTVATVLQAGEPRRFGRLCESVVGRFGALRRLGSAGAALAMVATGQLDAAVATETAPPWDTVAGVCLVRGAGGRVTDAAGERWTPDSAGLIASNGRAHDALVAAVES